VCAASIFIRGDYSMNYTYTDLSKRQNYIGFESGIFCIYPNYDGNNLLIPVQPDDPTSCNKSNFFLDHRREYYPDNPDYSPRYYEHRCRKWYESAYRSNITKFSEVYRFKGSNNLGITHCIPLYKTLENKPEDFIGAYCLDISPTSDNKGFVRQYFKSTITSDSSEGIVDYLIFDED
jgi:hypothetical protein